MKVKNLWWTCPKCKGNVHFGHELITLFDKDDNQSWFDAKFGVPFYVVKCKTEGCNATWNFGISPMYEE